MAVALLRDVFLYWVWAIRLNGYVWLLTVERASDCRLGSLFAEVSEVLVPLLEGKDLATALEPALI